MITGPVRVVSEIATNITGVATTADSTSQGVHEARNAATQLAQMSDELQQLVSRFRY